MNSANRGSKLPTKMDEDRNLDLKDTDASQYLEFLERFLGASRIDRRLRKLERELQIEKGLYLERWVIPIRSFWIGLRKRKK